MNLLIKIFMLLSFVFVSALAQKVIKVNTSEEFENVLTKEDDKLDQVTLCINTISFTKNFENSIKPLFLKWVNLPAIHSIVFQDIPNINGEFLKWFLSGIPDSNLTSLKLANVNISGNFQLPTSSVFFKLSDVSIIKTELDEEFFENFNSTNLPNLQYLELVNCDLDDDCVPYLKNSQLITQLEYLDLSQNEVENSVFSIFPMQQSGKLKTLKLNKCDIVLDKNKDYDADFLAVNQHVSKTQFAVDWDSPFFNKLEHLELQNTTDNLKEIEAYLQETKLQNLPLFLGFSFDWIRRDELLTKIRRRELYNLISAIPMQSIKNNYIFDSPEFLNIYLGSDQAKITENIILEGDRWNYLAVRTLLMSGTLPALTELTIINTPMSQHQVKTLIEEFKDISINAILRNPGEYWPSISTKEGVGNLKQKPRW